MTIVFDNASVVLDGKIQNKGSVIVNNGGFIEYVGSTHDRPKIDANIIDAPEFLITPGFIDIHTHGAIGVDFSRGDIAENLEEYSKWVVKTGVVGFLCSIAAPTVEELIEIIEQYVDVLSIWEENYPGARCLGLHLEGPFLNPNKKGAFNISWLRPPNVAEALAYIEAGKGWIKQITLAPELENSSEVAKLFSDNDIVVSLGHSDAKYELASEALTGYFSHITHLFNAQSGLHHREPGVVGAVMSSKGVTAEIISDLIHVHPEAIKIIKNILGTDRLCIITDATAAAGLEDGKYFIVGLPVTVENGIARLDDGTLAGSTSTMIQSIKNLVETVSIPIVEVIRMASKNPAEVIGEHNVFGSIGLGGKASFCVLNKQLDVLLTLVNGNIAYKSNTFTFSV